MTTTAEEEFAAIIRAKLGERFQDEFVFDPILVRTAWNLDGVRYLHAYIVFAGDQKKLEPAWTAALPRLLWPHAQELDYPGLPLQTFVEKSEWPRLEATLQ